MSRISIEVTPDQHRHIKVMAAANHMPIKDFVLQSVYTGGHPHSLKEGQPCLLCEVYGGKNRKLSKRTGQAIKDSRAGKDIKRFTSLDELFADLKS